MKLLETTLPPTNKSETVRLSIENTKVLIAIIPGSDFFRVTKPYTAENIDQRLNKCARKHAARKTDRPDELFLTPFEISAAYSGTVIAPQIGELNSPRYEGGQDGIT